MFLYLLLFFNLAFAQTDQYPVPFKLKPAYSGEKVIDWVDIDGATQSALLQALGTLSSDQITSLGITQSTPQTLTRSQALSLLSTLSQSELTSFGVTKTNLLSILGTLSESEQQTLGIQDTVNNSFVVVQNEVERANLEESDVVDGGWVYEVSNEELFRVELNGGVQFHPILIESYHLLSSTGQTVLEGGIAVSGSKVYLALSTQANVTTSTDFGQDWVDLTATPDLSSLLASIQENQSDIQDLQNEVSPLHSLVPHVQGLGAIDNLITFEQVSRAGTTSVATGYSHVVDYNFSGDTFLENGTSYDTSSGSFNGLGTSNIKFFSLSISTPSNHEFLAVNVGGAIIPLIRGSETSLGSGVFNYQFNSTATRNSNLE